MDLQVTPTLVIPDDELEERFIQASGPGGQNVNKVATAVQLRFDVRSSSVLPEEVKERLLGLAGRRATQDGVLVLQARRHRTQERNREDARERLADLVRRSLEVPRPRRPTRPTGASRLRRLDSKRRRGDVKRLRGPVAGTD
ncbi:MAG: alternative ribosome rescue aminoacyl-tRNA hydrolase ArfB [Pseudomonadota bacterium]